jgi:tetratricopeptide (TPR) repeat protein
MMRLCWVVLSFALVAAPARAAEPNPPPPANEAMAKTPAQQADELFDRLARTTDSNEAAGIVSALDRLSLRSGSDTSDLLMSRAIQAMSGQDYRLALSLLDATVDLRPEWAEAWNKRATARYFAGDAKGSMADIAQTLKRDPRHLGALAGLGAILTDAGLLDDALRAYDKALAIAPRYQPIVDAASRVKAALAGRSL